MHAACPPKALMCYHALAFCDLQGMCQALQEVSACVVVVEVEPRLYFAGIEPSPVRCYRECQTADQQVHVG